MPETLRIICIDRKVPDLCGGTGEQIRKPQSLRLECAVVRRCLKLAGRFSQINGQHRFDLLQTSSHRGLQLCKRRRGDHPGVHGGEVLHRRYETPESVAEANGHHQHSSSSAP